MQDIVSRLEQQLSDDISRIHLTDNNVASRHAVQRLKAVAEHAPALLAVLAEPWLASFEHMFDGQPHVMH